MHPSSILTGYMERESKPIILQIWTLRIKVCTRHISNLYLAYTNSAPGIYQLCIWHISIFYTLHMTTLYLAYANSLLGIYPLGHTLLQAKAVETRLRHKLFPQGVCVRYSDVMPEIRATFVCDCMANKSYLQLYTITLQCSSQIWSGVIGTMHKIPSCPMRLWV